MRYVTQRGSNQEDYILHMKQQLRLVHEKNAPCGGPRVAKPGK